MARRDIVITTPDGQCPATLHLPNDPGPAVIVYPDAGGAREVIREMGDRLASLGCVALVPDVYYREGDWAPFDLATVFGDSGERARLFTTMGTLTPDRIEADAGAFLDALAQQPEVTGDKVGLTGYCMGGRISLRVAATHADRVAAAASFHGGNLAKADDPNSPHHLADKITGVVLVAAAEEDASFGPEQAELLDRVLTEAGVRHTIETYPALHGFAVTDNATYDKAAADRHWRALENLYGNTLGDRLGGLGGTSRLRGRAKRPGDVMLFEPRLRAGIHDGTISVAYRRWTRPQVKVGGRYRVGSDRIRSMTEFDFIEVDAVDQIAARDIDDADAHLAGYPSAEAARRDVGADGADSLYRLAFRKIEMADPRAELASSAALTDLDIADIDARLDRMDRSANPGPWTREVLREIAQRPEVRAKDLESCARWPDLASFKVHVRKLKNLGLTLSLPVGYRLSPRGQEYLARTASASS